MNKYFKIGIPIAALLSVICVLVWVFMIILTSGSYRIQEINVLIDKSHNTILVSDLQGGYELQNTTINLTSAFSLIFSIPSTGAIAEVPLRLSSDKTRLEAQSIGQILPGINNPIESTPYVMYINLTINRTDAMSKDVTLLKNSNSLRLEILKTGREDINVRLARNYEGVGISRVDQRHMIVKISNLWVHIEASGILAD